MPRLLLASLALIVLPAAPPAAAGGGAWAPTTQATQGFDHLSAMPDGTFFVQHLDTYLKSTDHGLTWQRMPRPPGSGVGVGGIRFATPEIGYAVGGGPGIESLLTGDTEYVEEIKRCGGIQPLRRTTDGGETWRAICVPRTTLTSDPRFGPAHASFALGAEGRTLALFGDERPRLATDEPDCGEDQEIAYTSLDGGVSWRRFAFPRGWYGGYRQYVVGKTTIARLTYGKWTGSDGSCASGTTALFLSRDGGTSYQRVYTCAAPRPCTSVALPTRDRIVLGRNDGSTVVSSDGGRTWRAGQRLWDVRNDALVASGHLSAGAFWVQGLSFVDGQHGYASTRGAGTWRTSNGGRSWTQERSHECQWFQFGVGEVAAGTRETAITGGPHFISARVPAESAPDGCAVQPEVPAVTGALVAQAGPLGYRLDGSATFSR